MEKKLLQKLFRIPFLIPFVNCKQKCGNLCANSSLTASTPRIDALGFFHRSSFVNKQNKNVLKFIRFQINFFLFDCRKLGSFSIFEKCKRKSQNAHFLERSLRTRCILYIIHLFRFRFFDLARIHEKKNL